ncbi:hypothetical protein N9O57_02325, partial [bacterium]|nr:hypothetical protein [bacterium]
GNRGVIYGKITDVLEFTSLYVKSFDLGLNGTIEIPTINKNTPKLAAEYDGKSPYFHVSSDVFAEPDLSGEYKGTSLFSGKKDKLSSFKVSGNVLNVQSNLYSNKNPKYKLVFDANIRDYKLAAVGYAGIDEKGRTICVNPDASLIVYTADQGVHILHYDGLGIDSLKLISDTAISDDGYISVDKSMCFGSSTGGSI